MNRRFLDKTNTRLLILDENEVTLAVLLDGFRQAGYKQAISCATRDGLSVLLEQYHPDIVVFNVHTNSDNSRQYCEVIKSVSPAAAIVFLVAPGEISRTVEHWPNRKELIDRLLFKPLPAGSLTQTIEQLLTVRQRELHLHQRNRNLASILPQAAVDAADEENQTAQLKERAILFTDVRRSSALIESLSAENFFRSLNESLIAQGQIVRNNQGDIVKFTGDGMLATFSGFGRVHLALRCALQLQQWDARQKQTNAEFRIGIGMADGLVMSGFVGDRTRRQYDVIGSNVHLAARFCSLASEGQIVLPQDVLLRSYLPVPGVTMAGEIDIKGFSKPVSCCIINYPQSEGSRDEIAV
jgi:class 3 adenylate cyclase